MILLGKNKSIEFKKLEEYKNIIEKLIKNDKYISKKEYIEYYNDTKEIYNKLVLMEKEKVLSSWCKKQKDNYSDLKELINFYENTFNLIDKTNNNFISKHLESDKEYLDKVLIKDEPKIMLDEEQRKVVLSDEDYTLVVAGAGAGKTTTIEAKVKYLIDKQNVDPERILIISFTKKATKELSDRCKKMNLPVKISTFHSLANSIINYNNQDRFNIAPTSVMFSSIKKYLLNNTNDEIFIKKVLLFFASYLEVPIDEENIAVLFNELNKNDCTTLKSDVIEALDAYKDKQERKHTTIKKEVVKSIQECQVANFLFINGIDYKYEPIYEYGFSNTTKPYLPDFVITQHNKKIYLEHFGISEDGKNNRYTQEELDRYKKHINDKILLHRKHGTKLIYTFSKYKDGRSVIEHLKEELQKAGISFEEKNKKEIYNAIIASAEDKYFNRFIELICVFISRFKTNNFQANKFDEWKITLKDERTKLFIEICYKCYLAYMTELKKSKSIDFEDMINNASRVLDNMIAKKEFLPFDYIFVDEYQDISLQRFDLCEKLSKCSNAKIVAVGDDWQSIFRFSGAKIELFTKFEQLMGYANILKITNTYRNSQELIDIAGNFVMENTSQIKKSLKSNKSINYPITLFTYDDSYKKDMNNDGPGKRAGNAIEKALDMLVKEYGENQNILFIGRYGFEGYSLSKLKEGLFIYNNGELSCPKYPKLKLTYLTAHSSKGLGYDNVIIINAKDAILGFPSKIEDDPVMKLVIKDDESFDYAEERRLFYVALTRTKNKVFIITPKYKPSEFILEIKKKYNNILLSGVELEPQKEISNILKCPICGYPLQRRVNNNFKIEGKIWLCSNEPEICGYITNDLSGGKMSITKCPKCEDGYLIVKSVKNTSGNNQKMLGCTNYKPDGTGCDAYIMHHHYTEDKEELSIKFYDEKTDINKVRLCNHSFIEMVNTTLYVINYYRNFKISIGPRLLFSILSGEYNKTINTFKLFNNPKFGYITYDDKRKFYSLFAALKEEKIIYTDDKDYGRVIVIKDNLDENDYKIIYASIKL